MKQERKKQKGKCNEKPQNDIINLMILFLAMLFYPVQLLQSKVQELNQIKGLKDKFYLNRASILMGLVMITVLLVGGLTVEHTLKTLEVSPAVRIEPIDSEQVGDSNPVPVSISKSECVSEKPKQLMLSFTDISVYQVTVNNRVVASYKTESEANALIEALKDKYTNEIDSTLLKVYFGERVEVCKKVVDIAEFKGYDTIEGAMAYIINGFKENKFHVVKKGENYWIIASYYGIDPSELERANPETKPESLQIGQSINLTVPKSLITVYTVEDCEYHTEIPFDIVYEPSDELYKSETKTKTSGQLGEKAIRAQIIRRNGLEVEREIVEETIISEPMSKVVLQGTKNPPPKMGSGILSKPTSRGAISSEFGMRWGRRHQGVDIGVPENTEVKAADGGTVIYAAYSSSYGNYIIIDHGENISTLYAHNNKLLVKKGDQVYKGQLISLSGNTGNSKAPHLHFEVRQNGVPQNPRNYLNFDE